MFWFYLKQSFINEFNNIGYIFFATISTVVCMYLNGREISAEGTPPLENAKESVSVPVALLKSISLEWNFLFSGICD